MSKNQFIAAMAVCVLVPFAVLVLYCTPAKSEGLFLGPELMKRNARAGAHPKAAPTYEASWLIDHYRNLTTYYRNGGTASKCCRRTSGAPRSLRWTGW